MKNLNNQEQFEFEYNLYFELRLELGVHVFGIIWNYFSIFVGI